MLGECDNVSVYLLATKCAIEDAMDNLERRGRCIGWQQVPPIVFVNCTILNIPPVMIVCHVPNPNFVPRAH